LKLLQKTFKKKYGYKSHKLILSKQLWLSIEQIDIANKKDYRVYINNKNILDNGCFTWNWCSMENVI